jgi:DNA-binding NarL/FixJ family response regulator
MYDCRVNSTEETAKGFAVMALTTVLLADDHTIVAEGLEGLLKDRFKLVGTVRDGRALLAAADHLRPDVIVTDICMPLLNGLDAVRQIKISLPKTKVVVLTMHADPHLAVQAFRNGASAYLLKVSSGEELVRAIDEALQGRVYLSSLISKDLISLLLEANRDLAVGKSQLTPRQREVLQLIAEGRTMKDIASILNISRRTAETHKYDMMESLGVDTTATLIRYAMRLKLVS